MSAPLRNTHTDGLMINMVLQLRESGKRIAVYVTVLRRKDLNAHSIQLQISSAVEDFVNFRGH